MRFIAITLSIAIVCHLSPSAFAEWDCKPVNEKQASGLASDVRGYCVGLDETDVFWLFGREGHYPASKRNTTKLASMDRVICTDKHPQAQNLTVHAVGAVQNRNELELFCVEQQARDVGSMPVSALNAILLATKAAKAEWISANSKQAQDFYKSLKINCQCDQPGRQGDPMVMKFSVSKLPIEKKERVWRRRPGAQAQRLYFDSCMPAQEYEEILGKLRENPRDYILETRLNGAAAPGNQSPILISDPRANLDLGLSERWYRDHPTICK